MRISRVLICLFGILLTQAYAASTAERPDLLDINLGAIVLHHTAQRMECPEGACYPATGIIDGTIDEFWLSPRGKPFPHAFVIELDRVYLIDALAVDNRTADENVNPGISSREVVFSGSNQSPKEGFSELLRMQALVGDRKEVDVPTPRPVRWLKIEIKSNHGNRRLTEMIEAEAYGKPVGEKPPQPDPSGVYLTNYGVVRLQVTGNRVEGCYVADKGYFSGETNGRAMTLDWVEHGGSEYGSAKMVLSSSGVFLSGLWYQKQFKGVWQGNRITGKNMPHCDIVPIIPNRTEQPGARDLPR